jgi:putative protein kinase ArgK-like GTPase of G3E family
VNRQIIGLTGLMGSGKSLAAQELERIGFTRTRFAGSLKDMMRVLGLTEEEIEGNLKETACALLGGKTPRYAMQTIGTEWGRSTPTIGRRASCGTSSPARSQGEISFACTTTRTIS